MSEEITIRDSALTLYKNCEILPEKNFFVEDIVNYLATLDNESISSFQYLRIALSMEIKLQKSEEFTEYLAKNNFNYLKVVQNSRTYYFFIINKTQTSESTITLSLLMDTINTLRWGTDFTASSRTKVLREHKNRYQLKEETEEFSFEDYIDGTFEVDLDNSLSLTGTGNEEITEEEFNKITYGLTDNIITLYDHDKDIYLNNSDFNIIDFNIQFLNNRIVYDIGIEFNDSSYNGDNISNENITLKYEKQVKKYAPRVDLYSEGLNPVLYKEELGELEDTDKTKWFLMYKTNSQATEDNPTPVSCYLIPEEATSIKLTSDNTLAPSDFGDTDYLVFARATGTNASLTFRFGSNVITIGSPGEYPSIYYFITIRKDPNDATQLEVKYYIQFTGTNTNTLLNTYYASAVEISSVERPIKATKTASISSSTRYYLSTNWNYTLTTNTSTISLTGFNDIDRTESLLLKIFALPYNPANYTLDNGILVFSDEWAFDISTGLMKLKDLNTKFSHLIETSIDSPFTYFASITWDNTLLNHARFNLDPKLKHSDFYQPKFVYDSFGFTFQLEKMDQEESYNQKFSFDFVMTSTIRSRFMFKFEEYRLFYSTEDFDNILSVARNNEAVIYNSAYLTYLRTGYNIDIKAKERTQTTAILGGIFGGVGAVAGGALSIASGNPAVAIRGVISGVSSFASSIVNTINTIKDSEESMERKLATLRAQAISVEGSDDIDLLDNYSNNRAKLVAYKVSPRMEKALDDLFYYTGYIANEMKSPSIDTRIWFNFLSCEIVFDAISSNIPQLIKEDLINKYKEGVIFLHKYDSTWNFALNKENWEKSLVDLLN